MKYSRGRARRRRVHRPENIGVVLRCLVVLLLGAVCVALLHWNSSDSPSMVVESASAGAGLADFISPQPLKVEAHNKRLVYPFSVVPGGVASGDELRNVAAHDPVVAAHYSGFDFKKAHVVAVDQPKLVYLSYRRNDHVYWTHRQASLHKGELVLTDGHITARTRCGNQVSVLPQADVSPNEPTMAELERPDAIASGIERILPGNFNSQLLEVDPGLPIGPSSAGSSFSGLPQPVAFVPFPVGGGSSGGPITTPGNGCPPNSTGNNCPPVTPPPGPPGPPPPTPVPEPGTIVLTLSGAAAVIARLRHQRSKQS